MARIGGRSEAELRVLGCLIEKQRTTPDHYPLTLNALLHACNQSTNRDPVVSYDESTVRDAVQSLVVDRLVRSASGHSGRTLKYRHLLPEVVELDDGSLALLAVLMLRGPQTPGELRQRVDRLHHFESRDELFEALEALVSDGYLAQVSRRPGQKEERYRHLLGSDGTDSDLPSAVGASEGRAESLDIGAERTDDRFARLEAEVTELRREVDELRRRL